MTLKSSHKSQKKIQNFPFIPTKTFFNIMTLKKCHFLTTLNYSHKLVARKNYRKSKNV